jgi:hypothetical protein
MGNILREMGNASRDGQNFARWAILHMMGNILREMGNSLDDGKYFT